MTVDAAREGRKDAGSTPATSTMITNNLKIFWRNSYLLLIKVYLDYAPSGGAIRLLREPAKLQR